MNRNFNQIYQEIYQKGFAELKNLRATKNLSAFALIIYGLITTLLCIGSKVDNVITIIIGIGGVVLIIFTAVAHFKYRKAFKDLVIKKLVNAYDPTFHFSEHQGVSRWEYKESKFDNYFDNFYSEDLISGALEEKYRFKMSQVKTEKEEWRTDENGKDYKTTTVTFLGLYGIVDIKDSMNMKMSILPNHLLKKYDMNRIEVDSTEFEKRHDLFSTDKVRTMEIFTPDMLEIFNKFESEMKRNIEIKVVPGRLYFRISCGDVFEAPFFKDALSFDNIYNNFKMIDFPISIISEIIKRANEDKK